MLFGLYCDLFTLPNAPDAATLQKWQMDDVIAEKVNKRYKGLHLESGYVAWFREWKKEGHLSQGYVSEGGPFNPEGSVAGDLTRQILYI